MPGLLDMMRGYQQTPEQTLIDNYGPAAAQAMMARGGLLGQQGQQMAPQQPQQAAPQQMAPQQSAPQGGGLGGLLSGLLGGPNNGRNQTEQWLQQQGLDAGMARIVASDKGMLQKFIVDSRKGVDPKEALQVQKLGLEIDQMRNPGRKTTVIDGKLVDTDTGKVIGDYGSESRYRDLSPEEVAQRRLPPGNYQEGPNGEVKVVGGVRDQDAGLSREAALRKEYIARPEYKRYEEVDAAFNRVQASSARNTGAGDVGLVFSFMKMLDPGSVVREGEFATAENSAGIPSKVRNMYNAAISGERLTPEQRKEFVGLANDLYKREGERIGLVNEQFTGIAKQYGINPENFIVMPRVYGEAPPLTDGPPAPVGPAGPLTISPNQRTPERVVPRPGELKTMDDDGAIIDWKDYMRKR